MKTRYDITYGFMGCVGDLRTTCSLHKQHGVGGEEFNLFSMNLE